jgi:hypothetical protein
MSTPEKKYDLSGVDGAAQFRTLPEGLKVKMTNGSIGEIIGNPGDGAYLLVRVLEDSKNPNHVGEEQPVFFTDVVDVVE